MSGGFKDSVAGDNLNVFMNAEEFADLRTVRYDGEVYEDIRVVITGDRQIDRKALRDDHVQGIFRKTRVLHCRIDDLDGRQPEQGQRIWINSQEGGGGFFSEYRVGTSLCEMGMLQVELEAFNE
ncbi:MAG: hypothetical protein FWE80_01580 [Oscillospiraceae bacterium]|nr:hypothetical protein [Oscillospiraceae bacterium]